MIKQETPLPRKAEELVEHLADEIQSLEDRMTRFKAHLDAVRSAVPKVLKASSVSADALTSAMQELHAIGENDTPFSPEAVEYIRLIVEDTLATVRGSGIEEAIDEVLMGHTVL